MYVAVVAGSAGRKPSAPAVVRIRRISNGRSCRIRKDGIPCAAGVRGRRGEIPGLDLSPDAAAGVVQARHRCRRCGPVGQGNGPSARAIVVLVFWSYFETRIERLFRETSAVPKRVMEYLLERHGAGARLDRLYKVVYSTTCWADLNNLGYGSVATLLRKVQDCRNDFAHGQPEAIDDSLVEELVTGLKDEHEAWIAVFNRRLAATR